MTIAAVAASVTAGCGGGLQFAKDSRVRIVEPHQLATVTTPVHLRWVATARASYAVFVDSLPVHPGQNLRALAGPRCAGVVSCVDEAWLNRHYVFLASRPDLELDALPILATAKGERDMHTATIVLVDSTWKRLGESAWTVTFGLRTPVAP